MRRFCHVLAWISALWGLHGSFQRTTGLQRIPSRTVVEVQASNSTTHRLSPSTPMLNSTIPSSSFSKDDSTSRMRPTLLMVEDQNSTNATSSNNNASTFTLTLTKMPIKIQKKSASPTSSTTPRNPADKFFHDPKVYIAAVPDRSGTDINRMLTAHAWAFSRNYTYFGLCEAKGVPHLKGKRETMRLLQALGWQDMLPYQCPPPEAERSPEEYHFLPMGYTLPGQEERRTPAWLDYIQSHTTYPMVIAAEKGGRKRAVIHIRRGDLDLCKEDHARHRYLPNWYFKELVERHVPQDHDIVIYSEESSFEPWSDFFHDNKRTYDVRLSTRRMEAWHAFMTADIFIDSRSFFSVVPAMLNQHGTIIHTPKRSFEPLPHWTVVDESLWKRAVEWSLERYRECTKQK